MADSFLAAKQLLSSTLSNGIPSPLIPATGLELSKIKMVPELFQHRRPLAHASEVHIKDLVKVLERGSRLDEVTVFWTGKDWVCIDGHHRLAAYKKAEWRKGVAVLVFVGTIDAAMAKAASGNTKNRLHMRTDEKFNAAWRLTVGTELSKRVISITTGTSEGTGANMRRVKTALLYETPNRDLSELTWGEAQRDTLGGTSDEIDWDAKKREEAQQLANKIIKAIGIRGAKDEETLAMALEIIDQRLPAALATIWREHLDTDFGGDDEF